MNVSTLDSSLVLCLTNVPVEHWAAAWPAESTVMFRMTSKAVREAVDQIRGLPVAVSCKSRNVRVPVAVETADRYIPLCQLRLLSRVCLVTTLKLIDCLLQGEAVRSLAAVLPQCRALEHLDLSFNCMGDAGVYMLQTPIARCARLTKLVMTSNCFGDEGASRIAEVLTHMPALEYLDVARNSISGPGLQSIAQALPHCPRISVLILSHNRTADAVGPLADVLPLCQALTLIDVSYTDLGMMGLMLLFATKPHLRCLTIHAVGNADITSFKDWSDIPRLNAVLVRME